MEKLFPPFAIIFLLSVFSINTHQSFAETSSTKVKFDNKFDDIHDSEKQIAAINSVPKLDYQVVSRIKRKANMFTQGLVIENDNFYESSGRFHRSFIKKYTIAFNQTDNSKKTTLKKTVRKHFAEGLTLFNQHIYLLTWQSGLVYQLTKDKLNIKKTFHIKGEGWGLTHNNKYLILSDGSDQLHFYNERLKPIRSLNVHHNKQAIKKLNELEWVNGLIYANVWQNNNILIINANNGKVKKRLDISPLIEKYKLDKYGVLNGIAYHQERHSLFITGKLWPYIFEIKPKEL